MCAAMAVKYDILTLYVFAWMKKNGWHGACIYVSGFRKVQKPGGFKKNDMCNN